MSFKLQGRQLVVCFELGNRQKVEIFELLKHGIKKIEQADFAFDGVCLMIQALYGEIWSVDMQGNVYLKEIPDQFFKDLTPKNSKQIQISEPTSQMMGRSTSLLGSTITPIGSDFLISETEASNFIHQGKFVKKRSTFEQRDSTPKNHIYKENLEQTGAFIKRDLTPKKYDYNEHLLKSPYGKKSPVYGNHLNKSPVIRVNRYVIEHPPRVVLQHKRSNINLQNPPFLKNANTPNRSRTPVKNHNNDVKLANSFFQPILNENDNITKENHSPVIGKSSNKKSKKISSIKDFWTS